MYDILDELRSYYDNTYGVYDNKVVRIMSVYPTFDRDDDEERDTINDSYEILEAKDLGLFECEIYDVLSNRSTMANLKDIRFYIPDSTLVSIKRDGMMHTSLLSKRTARHWKRAVSMDYITRTDVVQHLHDTEYLLTGYMLPTFPDLNEARRTLREYPGIIAISPDFWISSTGTIGYLKSEIGTYTDTVINLNNNLSFLKEELQEIGGEYATVVTNRSA